MHKSPPKATFLEIPDSANLYMYERFQSILLLYFSVFIIRNVTERIFFVVIFKAKKKIISHFS